MTIVNIPNFLTFEVFNIKINLNKNIGIFRVAKNQEGLLLHIS